MSGFLDYPFVPEEYKAGGKIHIKESKKGTFTAAAKRRGMSVQEFAAKVLANKGNYSSAMVKKANFARNSSKWHSDGGLLQRLDKAYGGDRQVMLDMVREVRQNRFDKGGDRGTVKQKIDAWVKAHPKYKGIDTTAFADWLLETSKYESNYGRYMTGKKSDGSNSGYNGYFGLKIDPNASFDAQMDAAFGKIHQILNDQIVDYDINRAKEIGISQAQLLHKYWNQGNRVTNYLHNGLDTTDGAGTHISDYGNDDMLEMDYSPYVRKAITDTSYTIRPGDNFSRIQSAVRLPGRDYNRAGRDLVDYIRKNNAKFDSTRLSVGQTLKWADDVVVPEFQDYGRPKKSDYYTRLSNKDEKNFQQWYYDRAVANNPDISYDPNDARHEYDYRGYWKEATPAQRDSAATVKGYHLPDTYKWPGHPTFSVDSKFYDRKTMETPGHFEGDVFVPGPFNLLFQEPGFYAKNKFEEGGEGEIYYDDTTDGGWLYGPGGWLKNAIIDKAANKGAEYTKGLLSKDEVKTILKHPKDFSKYLDWDEDKVNEIKNNLYSNFSPWGYDLLTALASMRGDGYQEYPIGASEEEKRARDYLFAEYLGIPEEKRKYNDSGSMFERSPYSPTIGSDNDTNYVRFASDEARNRLVDIYNSLLEKKVYKPGEKEKVGKEILSHYKGDTYALIPGKSGANYAVSSRGVYEFDKDPYASALGQYTLGVGNDANRGQYVSVYDKWDLNPFSVNASSLPRRIVNKLSPLGDLSGGFGNPVEYYDRIYLDDYYGVSSKPDVDSYYGGYIVPSVVSGEK